MKFKAFAKRLYPRLVVDIVKLNAQNFDANPPVLVYQMGKVGSTTICRSLRQANVQHPIYHVHFLSQDGIKSAEAYARSLNNSHVPYHLRFSKALSKKIAQAQAQWKIITLVREPIGWEVSNFFQNVARYYPDLIERGQVNQQAALARLTKTIADYDESSSYVSTWFDRELKVVFGVDVYAHPFDRQRGFSIIREANVSVLILRLEDLNHNFSQAVTTFLELDKPIEMFRSNVAQEKGHAQENQFVLENLRIPEAVCARIYASRYVRHFYGADMQAAFTQRWTGIKSYVST